MKIVSRAAHAFDDIVFRLLGKVIARQFVVFGGVPAVLSRGKFLRGRGIAPTYNRIDEHVHDKKQIASVCTSYIELIHGMDETNFGNVAIKPSAFGMEIGPTLFAQTLNRFIEAVRGHQLEIEIDAERREMLYRVQGILNILQPKLPEGITFRPAFQMHLPEEFRKKLLAQYRILDMPVRIVKGSGLYNVGSEEVSAEELFARYVETFRDQIARGKHPNVATVRDKELLKWLTGIAALKHISPDEFTIQFLDGFFGRSLARKCVAAGYHVGCYVPFVDPSAPDEWRGYVQRRIAFGRSLLLKP